MEPTILLDETPQQKATGDIGGPVEIQTLRSATSPAEARDTPIQELNGNLSSTELAPQYHLAPGNDTADGATLHIPSRSLVDRPHLLASSNEYADAATHPSDMPYVRVSSLNKDTEGFRANDVQRGPGAFVPLDTFKTPHDLVQAIAPTSTIKPAEGQSTKSPSTPQTRASRPADLQAHKTYSHSEEQPRKKRRIQHAEDVDLTSAEHVEETAESVGPQSSPIHPTIAAETSPSSRMGGKKKPPNIFGELPRDFRDYTGPHRRHAPRHAQQVAVVDPLILPASRNATSYDQQTEHRKLRHSSDHLDDTIEEIDDPRDVDRMSSRPKKRRKTTEPRSLDLRPTREQNDDMQALPARNKATSTADSGLLRTKFVRDVDSTNEIDQGEEDELSQAPNSTNAGMSSRRTTTTQDTNPKAKIVGNAKPSIAQQSNADLPASDIKPSNFATPRVRNRSRERRCEGGNVPEYALAAYHSSNGNRTGAKTLRIVVDSKSSAWVIKGSSTDISVDPADIGQVYGGNMNTCRTHLIGRLHEGRNQKWHHLIFQTAIEQMRFRDEQLSSWLKGTKVNYTRDDKWLKKAFEKKLTTIDEDSRVPTPKKRKASPNAAAVQLSEARRKSRSSHKREEANSATKKAIRSSMRSEADSATARDDDAIKCEPTPSVNAARSKRPTRKSTEARREPETRPSLTEKSTPRRAASKDFDLGMRWRRSLVYPRQGANRATVDYDDLSKLGDGELLNDNLVTFCIQYAKHMSPKQSERVCVFNTYFYNQLLTNKPKGKSINFEGVKRWTQKMGIFEGGYDHILVPINEQYHWFLAIICNVPELQRVSRSNETEHTRNNRLEAAGTEPSPQSEDIKDTTASPVAGASDRELADSADRMEIDDSNDQALAEPLTKEGQHRASSLKKGKRRPAGNAKRAADDPVILIMDSLGANHPKVARDLKTWLTAEADDKIAMDIDEPSASYPRVPGQSNFSDCGVYLAGYVARFLEDPAGFLAIAGQHQIASKEYWPDLDPEGMRRNIRDLIMNEYSVQAREGSASGKNKKTENYIPPPMPAGATAYRQFTARRSDLEDTVHQIDESGENLQSPNMLEPDDPQGNGTSVAQASMKQDHPMPSDQAHNTGQTRQTPSRPVLLSETNPQKISKSSAPSPLPGRLVLEEGVGLSNSAGIANDVEPKSPHHVDLTADDLCESTADQGKQMVSHSRRQQEVLSGSHRQPTEMVGEDDPDRGVFTEYWYDELKNYASAEIAQEEENKHRYKSNSSLKRQSPAGVSHEQCVDRIFISKEANHHISHDRPRASSSEKAREGRRSSDGVLELDAVPRLLSPHRKRPRTAETMNVSSARQSHPQQYNDQGVIQQRTDGFSHGDAEVVRSDKHGGFTDKEVRKIRDTNLWDSKSHSDIQREAELRHAMIQREREG